MNRHEHIRSKNRSNPSRPRTAVRGLGLKALSVALVLVLVAAPASAQRGCQEDGKTMQCTAFGTITMDNQRDIRGDTIVLDTQVVLATTYESSGARWIMFSIRHDSPNGDSPISLSLKEFKSPHGDIFTSRIDHDIPNEINVWVHVVDVPTGVPLTLSVEVGAADRGAFRIETLVMPFDRGYEPLRQSDGMEQTLYSSTLLGVNEETGKASGGSDRRGLRTPGPELAAVTLGLLAVALLVSRRKDA